MVWWWECEGGSSGVGWGRFFPRTRPAQVSRSRTHYASDKGAQRQRRQPAIATLPAPLLFGRAESCSRWAWDCIRYFQILFEHCRARLPLSAESTLAAIAANPLIFSLFLQQLPAPISAIPPERPSPFPAARSAEALLGWQRTSQYSRGKPLPPMPCYGRCSCLLHHQSMRQRHGLSAAAQDGSQTARVSGAHQSARVTHLTRGHVGGSSRRSVATRCVRGETVASFGGSGTKSNRASTAPRMLGQGAHIVLTDSL